MYVSGCSIIFYDSFVLPSFAVFFDPILSVPWQLQPEAHPEQLQPQLD